MAKKSSLLCYNLSIMKILGILFTLIIIVIGLIFIFQNMAVIPITFAIWNFESPIGLVVTTAFVAGIVITFLFSFTVIMAYKVKNKFLKKNNDMLQKRLKETAIVFEAPGLGAEGESYKNN